MNKTKYNFMTNSELKLESEKLKFEYERKKKELLEKINELKKLTEDYFLCNDILNDRTNGIF